MDTHSANQIFYPLEVPMQWKQVPVALVLASTLLWWSQRAEAAHFDPGSMVIPMDTTYQDMGMLRAYGLVYELLRQGVPVHWVIKEKKQKGDADFTCDATDLISNSSITAHGYRGGPFVIDAADQAKAYPIITKWQMQYSEVNVHVTTQGLDSDIAKTLIVAPTIAMFADGNQKIARKYMQAAAIPDSTLDYGWPDTSPDMLDPLEVEGPTDTNHSDGKLFDDKGKPLYCQLMSMHWGVGDSVKHPEAVAEVRSFLQHPVHFFAECQGVNAFENHPNGRFLTPNGFVIGPQPNMVDFYHNDLPFGQIDGAFKTVGGSEPSYSLPMGDTYKAMGVVLITQAGTPEGINDVFMSGYLDGMCNLDEKQCGGLGKVSYLGGHEYSTNVPISANPNSQGTRMFLNSLFEADCATAAGQPNISFTKQAPTSTTQDTVTYTIKYNNSGPGVAFQVMIQDTLPMGTSFVSATQGGMLTGNTVAWNLGSLSPNEFGLVEMVVKLSAPGSFKNQAKLNYKVGLNGFTQDSNVATTDYGADSDGDGVVDSIDTCPNTPNPAQDLNTDPANCGMCGKVCTGFPNAQPGCAMGTCALGPCNTGYQDCNMLPADGCEAMTTSCTGQAGSSGSAGNSGQNGSAGNSSAGSSTGGSSTGGSSTGGSSTGGSSTGGSSTGQAGNSSSTSGSSGSNNSSAADSPAADEGGCGCRLAPSLSHAQRGEHSGRWMWLAALAGLLVSRRRKENTL
jgi:uncharacterized repeat protein (TIGR01451 family)